MEAEKCLAQSEKFKNEKVEFESEVYAKVCALTLSFSITALQLNLQKL